MRWSPKSDGAVRVFPRAPRAGGRWHRRHRCRDLQRIPGRGMQRDRHRRGRCSAGWQHAEGLPAAGILARFKEFEVETFQRVLDVNLTGTFRLCSACLPLLRQSRGSIINVASMNAFLALPLIPAYCASKGGVVLLTKSLALAWAEHGVRVNAIAPGYVEPPINAASRRDQAHYERIRSRIPLGRWAQPEDIAGSTVYLASPVAHYVTGTVLAVDGGFLAG